MIADPGRASAPQARFVDALRERWLLVVVLVGLAVSTAAAYSLTATPRYEASTDILVTPISSGDETFIGINLLREGNESRSVLTAARLIRTPQVADEVKERLGLFGAREDILKSIDVRPQQQSSILTVVGKADDAEQAAALANAFADVLIDERTALFQKELRAVIARLQLRAASISTEGAATPEAVAISQRLGDLSALDGANDPTLQVASRAVAPISSVWPRPVLSIGVALLVSLLIASGLALALETVNPRIRGEQALLVEQRLPILARIPRMGKAELQQFLTGQRPLPADLREGYRTLRASLAGAGSEASFPQTILVTSSVPGEGKTMTAVNLAATLAKGDLRVILVDGDLRRPMVGSFFGVPSHRAQLAQLLLGKTSVANALVQAPGYGDRLQLLLSSPEHGLLIDLLQSDRVDRLLADLQLEADVIVIDSPPLTEVADALILADAVEAVVVAVRLGRTGRNQLLELRRMLAQRGISPAGFVVTLRGRSRRGAYYGYGAESTHDAESRARSALRPLRREADSTRK